MSDKILLETEFKLGAVEPKSYGIAYLLFFTLGWAGAHRFYVGRWTTGSLYLVLLYFFEPEAIIFPMVIDFLLLYVLVKDTHTKQINDPLRIFLKIFFSKQGQQYQESPPWAETPRTPFDWFIDISDNLIRALLFIVSPFFVLLVAFYVDSMELAILMVFILVFAGYTGSMSHALNTMQSAFQQFPSLARIPFLTDAVDTIKQLYDYYYTHKPRHIIYYLFYPISIFLSLFSPKTESAVNEFRLYKGIIILILITLIIDSMFSYSSTYQPYLTIGNAAIHIFAGIFFSAFAFTFALIPTVTTCFKFRFSNNRKILILLTTVSLAIMAAFYYVTLEQEEIPFKTGDIIKAKLSKEAFKQKLKVKTEMFFTYYYPRIQFGDNDKIVFHRELTELYRQQLLALASEDELKTFRVIIIPEPNSTNYWLGIHFTGEGGDKRPILTLYLFSPTGTMYSSWANVPIEIKKQFTLVYDNENITKPYKPDIISQHALIDDYQPLLW